MGHKGFWAAQAYTHTYMGTHLNNSISTAAERHLANLCMACEHKKSGIMTILSQANR